MLNIPVICGSSRENRKSILVSNLVSSIISSQNHSSQVVDFASLPLPFVNTPVPPGDLNKNYPDANVQKWSSIVDSAEALVIVCPEYNHGYPGVLKNALDWLYAEYANKPVGLIGVSSGAVGGARVIEQLRPIVENFGMWGLKETVMFTNINGVFDEQGKLLEEKYNDKLNSLLSSLYSKAEALKPLRV